MIYAVGNLSTDVPAVVSRSFKRGETLSADSFLFFQSGNDACQTGTNEEVGAWLQNAKAGDVLLVQFEEPLATVEHALNVGARKGMITVLHSASDDSLPDSVLEKCELIVLSEAATRSLTGIAPDCEVHLALSVQKLQRMGARGILITLGKRGSAVCIGKEITLIPAKRGKAANTVAAEEMYVGAFAARLAAGDDMIAAATEAEAAITRGNL